MTPALTVLLALAASASAFVTGVDPNHPPKNSEKGMYGTNQCGTKDSTSSKCQTAVVNSAQDFCFFSGPKKEVVGNFERYGVSYCTKAGHGARLVPKGTFKNVHYVETPHYIQITATGDFTKVNIPKGDEGGELDPHGADGKGNPIGGLMFGFGGGRAPEQFENWTQFISYNEFCLRVCHNGADSRRYCEHIYDVMGCYFNMPGNYGSGFESCVGDDVSHPMGEYVKNGKTSKWYQGVNPTPAPNPAPKSSKCSKFKTLAAASYPKSKRFGEDLVERALETPAAQA